MASVAVLEILRSKRIGVTNLTFQGHVTLYLFIYILKCRLCISITVCCWCYNVASVCRRLSVVCNICRPIVVKRCVLPKKIAEQANRKRPMGNEWSCDRWPHVTLKGQGSDFNTLRAQYLENSWRCWCYL